VPGIGQAIADVVLAVQNYRQNHLSFAKTQEDVVLVAVMRYLSGLDYFRFVELFIVGIILKNGFDFLDGGVRDEHGAAPILDHSTLDILGWCAGIDPDFPAPQLGFLGGHPIHGRKAPGILGHGGFSRVDITVEGAGRFRGEDRERKGAERS
jgi:hypothetical protein